MPTIYARFILDKWLYMSKDAAGEMRFHGIKEVFFLVFKRGWGYKNLTEGTTVRPWEKRRLVVDKPGS